MYKFGKSSTKRKEELHPDLQLVLDVVIKHRDCSVLVGHRNESDQNEAVKKGFSRLKWPKSTHNKKPSDGMDVGPYFSDRKDKIPWDDHRYFYEFAGYVLAIADSLNIKLRWGGNWDGDGDYDDQTLNDLVHFELVK